MKNKAKSKKNFGVKGDKCPREGSMNKQINCKLSEVCTV